MPAIASQKVTYFERNIAVFEHAAVAAVMRVPQRACRSKSVVAACRHAIHRATAAREVFIQSTLHRYAKSVYAAHVCRSGNQSGARGSSRPHIAPISDRAALLERLTAWHRARARSAVASHAAVSVALLEWSL
nr:hypothetical protein [Pirellula staleyi]